MRRNSPKVNAHVVSAEMISGAPRQKPLLQPANLLRLAVRVASKHRAVRVLVYAVRFQIMTAPFALPIVLKVAEAVAVKAVRAPGVSKPFSSV